jgi:hypothetical protein
MYTAGLNIVKLIIFSYLFLQIIVNLEPILEKLRVRIIIIVSRIVYHMFIIVTKN